MEENLYLNTFPSPLVYRMRIIIPIWKVVLRVKYGKQERLIPEKADTRGELRKQLRKYLRFAKEG